MNEEHPFIPSETNLPEITLRVIVLSILLALILGIANAYLALKIGILTSASIPAAIISMSILRFLKKSNILENNLIQTAASAGEAVAGGIVFTIPALVIIGYWDHFDYWDNFFIAISGAILGVLYSIPLRRFLMRERYLNFPEGKAIAEVLKAGNKKTIGLKELIGGGLVGGLIELCQTGFKIIANSTQYWFSMGKSVFGFGTGFSALMIGAGYIMGFEAAWSILIGAIIIWGFGVPLLTGLSIQDFQHLAATDVITQLYATKIRYIGIGSMMVAGVWTLLILLRPFYISLKDSLRLIHHQKLNKNPIVLRTEQDMPFPLVLCGIFLTLFMTFFLFVHLFPLTEFELSTTQKILFIFSALGYLLVIGFIFSVIVSYFSGLVGVTATPGSAVVIAGLLIAAAMTGLLLGENHSAKQLTDAAAIAILIGSVTTGIACVSNDITQDLKVGYLLGATPWKQQVMLLVGATAAAAIIPWVMQLLFSVYGIATVLPHPDMNPNTTLPAPPAALMAALTQGVFTGHLPWGMILTGGCISTVMIAIKYIFRWQKLSILALAIGIYLPLSTTVPLFMGGLFAYLVQYKLVTKKIETDTLSQKNILLACGLVAGAALMDVLLAIPFALASNPDMMTIHIPHWQIPSEIIGGLVIIGLGFWFLAKK
jgi:putative OPT family oligopeptide transporter